MMKITKSDYDTILSEAIKESTLKVTEDGHPDIAFSLMLMGVYIGNHIKEKLFDNDNEVEIISNEKT